MPIAIAINKQELYDEEKKEFIDITQDYKLIFEHSLVSISKWESKWHKPFPYINENMTMTPEQSVDYIKHMTINKDVPDVVYNCLTPENINAINNYINDPMSATTVRMPPSKNPTKKETLTSELLYYYMFKLGIPKECEKWHINRLIKLIEIYCAKEGNEGNKMSRSELIARNKAINARNRAKYNSKG